MPNFSVLPWIQFVVAGGLRKSQINSVISERRSAIGSSTPQDVLICEYAHGWGTARAHAGLASKPLVN